MERSARSPGEVVVLRELWAGRIWSARAAIVVSDQPAERRLFTPAETTILTAADERGGELRVPTTAHWSLLANTRLAWNVLSFAWPTERYAVLVMWDVAWRFRMWYVNVEDPLRATSLGFDTTDCLLDIVIEPDRSSWRWKDEHELDEAVARGSFTKDDAEEFHEAADRGRRRVTERLPPFDREWADWRPDPGWPPAELSPGWDVV